MTEENQNTWCLCLFCHGLVCCLCFCVCFVFLFLGGFWFDGPGWAPKARWKHQETQGPPTRARRPRRAQEPQGSPVARPLCFVGSGLMARAAHQKAPRKQQETQGSPTRTRMPRTAREPPGGWPMMYVFFLFFRSTKSRPGFPRPAGRQAKTRAQRKNKKRM